MMLPYGEHLFSTKGGQFISDRSINTLERYLFLNILVTTK
jgi:hypothetical protein